MSILRLTKFDVAERQLLQAITMFFREDDVVSVHTVSEAAGQVLSDISGDYGVKNDIKNSEMIKPDMKREWIKHLNKSRNFFKHADNDKDTIHEFKPEINCFSLFSAVLMYNKIKKSWVPETQAYNYWFLLNYPHLIREDSEFKKNYEVMKSNGNLSDQNDKKLMFDFSKAIRNGELSSSNVNLEYGLYFPI